MSATRISWWVPVSLAPLLAAAVAVREHPSTSLPEPSAAVELERDAGARDGRPGGVDHLTGDGRGRLEHEQQLGVLFQLR